MYQPSAVWLATENCGDRWLTDQYVLLNITESDDFKDMPDGPYKLTVSKGPEPQATGQAPDPAWRIERYFEYLTGRDWKIARPTEWSVAEHPGKAQLWSAGGKPHLLGESTWTAIKRYHPSCVVEYSSNRRGVNHGIFRFMEEAESGPYIPFAYAAGIRIPEGQEAAAEALARA
jgi:hypothetical protein